MKIGTQAEFREWLKAHKEREFKRANICQCPIATWLGELNETSVVVDGTLARLARIDFSDKPLYHELPVWAKTFITRFDNSCFISWMSGSDAIQCLQETS